MKTSFLAFIIFYSITVWSQIESTGSYEAALPLFDKERILGDVKVEIQGEELIGIDKASLLEVLKTDLSSDTLKRFEALPDKIDPRTLPLPIRFNPEDLKLEMPVDAELRNKEKVTVLEDYRRRYESEAKRPASFAGAINSRLEQSWTSNPSETDFFNAQFDSFLNMNSLVLESQTYYQSNNEQMWFRGDTRLVKDVEKHQVRFQAGDVYPQIQGFMISKPIGGINVSRNFSLNPYRLAYPTGTQNFVLQSRSMVKYFVNGSLIKSEYLPPGNYTAKDIPLNNGLNTIVIEATDELGQKKVFVFRSAASINLLNEGESRFDLSYGTPFIDQNFKRDYNSESGNLFSGFYQYGFASSLSGSLYTQNQKEHTLLGSEIIHATAIGNFGGGYADSKLNELKGNAQNLSYQYIGSGKKWYFSQSLSLRYEHRSEEFRNNLFDTQSAVQNVYAANYALPISGIMTVSLGGNYGDVRNNNLNDKYGFDSTVNIRLFEKHNLSFFVGRNRDENKVWNDIAYAFLTITFPESNDFVSTFYDQKQKDTKVTYIHDNQNRLYSPKVQAIVQNNESFQMGETDMLFPTPVADFGGRVNASHLIGEDKVYGSGSLRMNSALVFAREDGEWGAGISRPISSSFVIFKPQDRLKKQNIALKSTSPYTEAETGLFGEITFSNLLAYQYREIQLDPTMLDEGQALQQERFVLFPTYKSGHLINLVDKGAVMVRGTLVNSSGAPWPLQVGHIGEKTFFTNRDGQFFLEGIEPGNYELELEGQPTKVLIQIGKRDKGIKDVGTLVLEEEHD